MLESRDHQFQRVSGVREGSERKIQHAVKLVTGVEAAITDGSQARTGRGFGRGLVRVESGFFDHTAYVSNADCERYNRPRPTRDLFRTRSFPGSLRAANWPVSRT